MAIFYISIIMVMRVIQSIYSKKANLTIPNGVSAYVKYITISKFLAAFFATIALFFSKESFHFNLQGFIIATCSGICLTINSFCGIKALSGGTMVLNSVFATSGLLIPCVLGIFVFNEPMSFFQVICIIALIVSVILLIGSSKKIFKGFSLSILKYLLGSFLTNGSVMFCQKLFGFLQPNGNVTMFSLLTFLIPSVLLLIFWGFIKARDAKEKANEEPFPKALVLYAVYLAFAVFIVQQFVTLLTPMLSSAVLFTFVNGGATIITTIVGAILYKEKITLKSAVAIIIAIISLILIKMV